MSASVEDPEPIDKIKKWYRFLLSIVSWLLPDSPRIGHAIVIFILLTSGIVLAILYFNLGDNIVILLGGTPRAVKDTHTVRDDFTGTSDEPNPHKWQSGAAWHLTDDPINPTGGHGALSVTGTDIGFLSPRVNSRVISMQIWSSKFPSWILTDRRLLRG